MKILVLMASYNGEKFIEEQIRSIFNQTIVSVELIVSDDNSSDLTTSIIEQLIKEGLSIKLIEREKGSGSAARNFMSLIKAIKNVDEYDFFAFSDQDDIWLPEKLYRATQRLIQNKSDLYISNLILWQGDHLGNQRVLKKSFKQKKYDFLFEGGSAGCTYVFNKQLFQELKIKTLKLNYFDWEYFSHDWFVYFIARAEGFKVFIDPEPFILYRIHENNVHGHLNTLSIDSIKTRISLIKNGWYFRNIDGFITLLNIGTKEHNIYSLYRRGLFSRIYVLLRYNFNLMRSPMKFIQFLLLSLLPQKKIKNV